MRLLGESGVWELFVPGVGDGTLYKFEVRGADGKVGRRPTRWPGPPSCRRSRPRSCQSRYGWDDDDWMEHARHATRTRRR